MFAPRGQIVRSARLSAEDGGATLTLSAPSVLITCHAAAESRRSLKRAAARAGVVLEPVEGDAYGAEDGTYNRRTGAVERPVNIQPNTFRAVGPAAGLRAVCESPCVRRWEFLVNVRVPHACGGTGTPSAGAERRIREGKRDACARAEDRERAERRPFAPADPDAATVRELAPGPDPDTAALVAELVRLARAGCGTDAERARVVKLRAALGV